MITLTAEVLCDSCGKVCGVGEPNARRSDSHRSVSDKGYWATSAIDNAEAKARSHGAQINVASVTCKECLDKNVFETLKSISDKRELVLNNPHTYPIVGMTPFVNKEGELCGLCDGTHQHEHPMSKCVACGAEGLSENIAVHYCNPGVFNKHKPTTI